MSAEGALLAALAGVALLYGVLRMAIHFAFRAPRIPERRTPVDFSLPFERIHLTGGNHRRLFAWFVPAGTEPAPAVALLHGWGGNAEQMLPFAVPLHRAGFAVLLLDARNHGRSESDGFSSMVKFAEDLEHGLDWLAEEPRVDAGCLAVLGHSVGAAAGLLAASRRKGVAAVVSVASFAHPERLMRRMLAHWRIPYRPLGRWILNYIERTIGARYSEIAPVNTIARINCPVLLIHGDSDQRVPEADAHAIHARRTHNNVELLLLPRVDHDSVEAIEEHATQVVDFLARACRRRSGCTLHTPSG